MIGCRSGHGFKHSAAIRRGRRPPVCSNSCLTSSEAKRAQVACLTIDHSQSKMTVPKETPMRRMVKLTDGFGQIKKRRPATSGALCG
jgi:hypothetical protein